MKTRGSFKFVCTMEDDIFMPKRMKMFEFCHIIDDMRLITVRIEWYLLDIGQCHGITLIIILHKQSLTIEIDFSTAMENASI